MDGKSGKGFAIQNRPLVEQIERTRTRRKSYLVDLGVQSPRTLGNQRIRGIETAPALVRLASIKGLDVIAVADYYRGDFIDPVIDAARESSLVVIPGVVIRCRLPVCDDVVLTCLFPEHFRTAEIEQFLQALEISPTSFGDLKQIVPLSFGEILSAIDEFQGFAVPSRMDKTPHRMGAIPLLVEQYGFRAFDLAFSESAEYFRARWPKFSFQLLTSSYATSLAQIGNRSARLKLYMPGFTGIKEIMERSAVVS